ncbi:hypothetical protein F4604DRAFT_2033825, partial [Suillus subluteus]
SKLDSLAWHDRNLTSIPALNLLLPTLNSLSLDISDASFRKAVFPGLCTAIPSLKTLDFVSGVMTTDDSSEIESEIESLLFNYPEGLTKLSLRCCDISNDLLDVIAPWPHLTWLAFRMGSKRNPTALRVPQPFRTLTTLLISCEHLSLVASFSRAVLRTDSDPSSIWSDIFDFLTYTKLEHMSLIESCHDDRCVQHHILSSLALHPLLARPAALADLETLVIHTTITIQDTDIATLARACPRLQFIDLAMCDPPISLYALAYLVGRCHELYNVALCLDVRLDALCAAPLEDDDQVVLRPNMCLTGLHVGTSPIAAAGPLDSPTAPDLMRSIPRFLHMIAPRLVKVMVWIGWPDFGNRFSNWERWIRCLESCQRWCKWIVIDSLGCLPEGWFTWRFWQYRVSRGMCAREVKQFEYRARWLSYMWYCRHSEMLFFSLATCSATEVEVEFHKPTLKSPCPFFEVTSSWMQSTVLHNVVNFIFQ